MIKLLQDIRACQRVKNEYPKLAPVNYSLENYANLSEHRNSNGCGFPFAARVVDVQSVKLLLNVVGELILTLNYIAQ